MENDHSKPESLASWKINIEKCGIVQDLLVLFYVIAYSDLRCFLCLLVIFSPYFIVRFQMNMQVF